ncbi:DNRLRE domain-containing protein [bacterium]|nr:DNRLRE domain-containing protein [bacterium]
MLPKPINRTTTLLYKSGRRRKIDVSVKRRYFPHHTTGELVPIVCQPDDSRVFGGYKFEVLNHDLLLAFGPGEKRLPFLRISDPKTSATWALWIKSFGNSNNYIEPLLIDRTENGVIWKLDDSAELRLEILGHIIRKVIVLNRRPFWNSITFIIARGGASLIDGLAIGRSERLLMAFRKNAQLFDNPLFWFSRPLLWDSRNSCAPLSSPNIMEPEYTIKPVRKGVWELRIDMDADWLDNAKYPVCIDPTIVLQPDPAEGKDNWLYEQTPNQNHGTVAYKCIGEDTHSTSGRAILEFDLSSIMGMSIISADLQLYWSGVHSDPNFEFAAYRILNDWEEMTSSWNYRKTGVLWTNAGGDIDSTQYGTTSGMTGATYSHQDIKALVQMWANGTANNGLMIKQTTVNSAVYWCHLYFSDSSTPSYRPKLTIEYEEGGIFIPAKLGALAGKGIINPLATGIII